MNTGSNGSGRYLANDLPSTSTKQPRDTPALLISANLQLPGEPVRPYRSCGGCRHCHPGLRHTEGRVTKPETVTSGTETGHDPAPASRISVSCEMKKKAAAAAAPAAGNATLACGNAECCKALAPPLLQCSKCKGEAYCCKACQVPPHPRAARGARALTRPCPSFPPPVPPPPPDCRVEGRAQAQVRCAGAG